MFPDRCRLFWSALVRSISCRNGVNMSLNKGLDWIDVFLAMAGIMMWMGMLQVVILVKGLAPKLA